MVPCHLWPNSAATHQLRNISLYVWCFLYNFHKIANKTLFLCHVMSYQLKNAFDKLFDDLMEDKTREMEPAEVSRDRKNAAIFFTVNLILQSLTDVCVNVCPYRQCALLFSHIKSRRSHGWPLVKTATICPLSGRRRMAFTLMFSQTLQWRKGQRKCLVGFWLMTWGWWDDLRLVLIVLNISTTSAQNFYAVFQGKTLTTIALIVSNFHNGKPLPLEQCVRCRWNYFLNR